MVIRTGLAALVPFVVLLLPTAARATPPQDGWVAWVSTRSDSRCEIYRARADGSEVTRMTFTGGTDPTWAPDGRWLAFKDDAGTVYLMRPDGSELQTLTTNVIYWPLWLHDNSGVAVQQGSQYLLYDPETKASTLMFELGDFPAFADGSATFIWNGITHDNRYLLAGSSLYLNGYTGANGSISAGFSAVIVDLLHKEKVYWFGTGCWPFTPPAGDLVFHVCGDCPTHPDIYHMHLADLMTRASYGPEVAHEDSDWGHEYNPRVSNDNKWLVYMASTGCHDPAGCDYDIWLHEIGAGPDERSRVTEDPGTDAYPSIYVGPFWQPASQPRLLVTPNRLTFFASINTKSMAKTLKLKNTGAGTLGPATLTIDSNSPWLSVALGSSEVSVGLGDLTGLARGTYQANILISVDGALSSPVTIPVMLVADDTFPTPEAGAPATGLDGGLLDAEPPTSEADAPGPGLPDAPVGAPGNHGSGCGCHLGKRDQLAQIWCLPLVGLALLVARLRRRTR